MNKFFNNYNSLCMGANSPAGFSFDPYFPAIKDMLVSELRQIVYYIEKLKDFDIDMTEYTDKVIEFVSVLIVNLDFRRESFFVIVQDLYENKNNLQTLYSDICIKLDIKPEIINEDELVLSDKESVIKALNEHEKNRNERKEHLTANKKNLYEIMINLVLNACNCLIELKRYGVDFAEAKEEVLKLFNASNFSDSTEEVWIEKIKEFSHWNYEIRKKLDEKIVEKFGPVRKTKAQFLMKKGKAILVSGSGLMDLDKILTAVKDTGINVYTHHNLICAYEYEKFNSNPNLAGHYQRTNNNFSLDFSSFPGPIYITKNSLPKIDIIRGQIYTSAKYPAFGIGKIVNDNFSPLIDYALKSDGFSENETIKTLDVGYDVNELDFKVNEIINKFYSNETKKIVIIGLTDKFSSPNEYITNFVQNAPENWYIISFAYDYKRENFWFANPYFDFSLLYKIIEKLNDEIVTEHLSVFLTDCSVNTISHIFNLLHLNVCNIFLGPCCPNIINPILSNGLNKLFNIKDITIPKTDIDTILQEKRK